MFLYILCGILLQMNGFVWQIFFKTNIILALIFSTAPVHAQFFDDFEDGDFTNNPVWSGNNELWTISGDRLQSNSEGAADYYLSTQNTLATNVEFEFFVNLKFGTSGSNYVDVYLLADDEDLSLVQNGYFIRIGDTEDHIAFYRVLAGSESLLFSSENGIVGSTSENPFGIRMLRDEAGLWTLLADEGVTGNYVEIGSILDDDVLSSSHFGIFIKQSTAMSPRKNHYFDDFSVRPIGADVRPPAVASIDFLSNTQWQVQFSEEVATESAEETSNYIINNSINPQAVVLGENNLSVILTFSETFQTAENYELSINYIEDLAGNVMEGYNSVFTFYLTEEVTFKDVLINEIMADFAPSIGLPEAEYVEIFNRSDKTFYLDSWVLHDATTSGSIEAVYLIPEDYLILTAAENRELLQSYGRVAVVDPWPSLNNGSDQLLISDGTFPIDSVNYDDAWYNSSSKASGGWSLELIDPENTCGGEGNWTASIDDMGGTPGAVNSVLSELPDNLGPEIHKVFAVAEDSILVQFNETLNKESVQVDDFTLNPTVEVDTVFVNSDLQSVWIVLSSRLNNGVSYKMQVSGITDCSGNRVTENDPFSFSLIENAEPGDVIINEILFNPRSEGVDFVEIYNNSSKHINLKNWTLWNDQDSKLISEDHWVLAPKEYLAFTEDAVVLKEQYPLGVETSFFEMPSLPSYPNGEGTVQIVSAQDLRQDSITYSEDQHFELINNVDGVSLERISFSAQASDNNNWKSAASSVGYATPGYINSQVIRSNSGVVGEIVIDPMIIIPDGSGQADFATISYHFEQPGFIANVEVFDVNGQPIRTLAENDYLSDQGFYTWDGTTSEGNKARMGYYIIYFQVFNANGQAKVYKNKVVVGSQF
ncbi:lamin tail domain-containing protein [Fulvivirga sediminis]|uniref:Lamin tail domain-containing protein n=1 Tax=Fulvivirga sediminis TaxID=2803949 RepID=A0A937JXG6_9BACT|nr:lamin tail domain-containing protein [Fulvivirga sediminis]MBL3654609.1 lamin tail domain-containing protein [Fulvivirga sediminis]